MRNFKEMTIWNEGMDLVVNAYNLTGQLPRDEEFGLKTQIRRAAVSIPTNIAEGCSRSSQKDFKRFLEISLGSAYEVETEIIIAQRLSFLSEMASHSLIDPVQILQKRISALITKVRAF